MPVLDSKSVLLVGPAPPPYGGMALQARLLETSLQRDGFGARLFPSNFALPKSFRRLEKVPGARTLARAILIWTKLFREMQDVEIVHVLAASWLYFFMAVYPAFLMAKIRRKRVVLNYRGGGAQQFFRWFGWALWPVFRGAHIVTTPSRFLADVIEDYFRVPVAIVPNIVDFSQFTYLHRSGVQPKLLVTRHLEKIYDISTVIRAFQQVQEWHPHASLWIAGSGSEELSLKSLVHTLQLRNVQFLGSIPHKDLPAIYAQCDIFINASLVDNFPGALLEASAAGLPIVTTSAGGIPFIYEHGKSALLSDPGNWQALAQSIEQLLASPSLAAKLSTEGPVVAQKCSWPEVSRALYEVYGVSGRSNAPAQVTTLV